jgi:predicted SAM-dependent methyltransferase|tara:strand:- start:3960 stop:4592 length:633 start_codon:yes stop_codon:yes gene_type:complete
MVNFNDIMNNEKIYLYAGDMNEQRRICKPFIGLSLSQDNDYHIKHNVENNLPLLENSVDIYQSEDVFEHIEYDKLVNIITDIYKVLKPGGLFRFSIPDYRCDILHERSFKDENGNIYHDIGGGGNYDYLNNKVIDGGHLWFPKYESVFKLFEQSKFDMSKVNFLHYYGEQGNTIMKDIDYTNGYITRTPDNDKRVQEPCRPMSIVVDCFK